MEMAKWTKTHPRHLCNQWANAQPSSSWLTATSASAGKSPSPSNSSPLKPSMWKDRSIPSLPTPPLSCWRNANVCLNFAAARTPIPSLDGLDPTSDRALLLPQFRIMQINDPNRKVSRRAHLPNTSPFPDPRLPLFADLLGGSVGTLQFPKPEPDDRNLVSNTASVTYALMVPSSLPLSDDLQNNFTQLQNRTWTLRLILLHRGYRTDENNNPVTNPWTNLQVDLGFDENGNGVLDPTEPKTRLYGPAEPMRTFPVASRWYDGDGQTNNDPKNGASWTSPFHRRSQGC
jgi:hypothetical protein